MPEQPIAKLVENFTRPQDWHQGILEKGGRGGRQARPVLNFCSPMVEVPRPRLLGSKTQSSAMLWFGCNGNYTRGWKFNVSNAQNGAPNAGAILARNHDRTLVSVRPSSDRVSKRLNSSARHLHLTYAQSPWQIKMKDSPARTPLDRIHSLTSFAVRTSVTCRWKSMNFDVSKETCAREGAILGKQASEKRLKSAEFSK
eukprot:1958820-Pleurochrysis_carterae.AAC.2